MLCVIPLPDALPVAVECREVVRDCPGVPCFADCRVVAVRLSERNDSGGFRLFRFVKRAREEKRGCIEMQPLDFESRIRDLNSGPLHYE